MKNKKNPARRTKIIVVCQAFITVAAVCASFFFLFEYRSGTKAENRKIAFDSVTMLSAGSLGREKAEMLADWLAIHDPALPVRGAGGIGYTAESAAMQKISVQFTPDTIVLPHPALKTYAPGEISYGKFKKTVMPPLTAAKIFPAEKVTLIDSAGKKIPCDGFFSFPPGGADKVTVIRMQSGRGIAPSGFTVAESCGNNELDSYALRELARMDLAPADDMISVIWQWRNL